MLDRVPRQSGFHPAYFRVESGSVWCHVNNCKAGCCGIVASQKYQDRCGAVDGWWFQDAQTGWSAVAETCDDRNQQQRSNVTTVENGFLSRYASLIFDVITQYTAVILAIIIKALNFEKAGKA